MSVVVYPQLAKLLEARRLTVAELERRIKERYGLAVNAKTLYRLAQAAPIQRTDLEIAGAAAAILGVGLDDLFTIDAVAADGNADNPILGPIDNRRMTELVDLQAQRLLTEHEWVELDELVAKYGQVLHERRLQARAKRRGISTEQERRETEAHLAQALEQWQASDIEGQQQALVDHVLEQGR